MILIHRFFKGNSAESELCAPLLHQFAHLPPNKVIKDGGLQWNNASRWAEIIKDLFADLITGLPVSIQFFFATRA